VEAIVSQLPQLAEGAEGVNVKRIQALVNLLAGFRLTVDGLFGPKTTHAIERFQEREGLVPDGIVGPLTWTALLVSDGAKKG
jgi:peptidoglycan hydrolase-like protein with peptidoglycan-binding domain